jgi:hypothetical protein
MDRLVYFDRQPNVVTIPEEGAGVVSSEVRERNIEVLISFGINYEANGGPL